MHIKTEQPNPITFSPDITKPFEPKDVVTEILLSDATKTTKYREHKGGISSKNLRELIKKYYGKTIGLFEISKLLMLDKAFRSVGKGCYIVNEPIISQKKSEPTIEPVLPKKNEPFENTANPTVSQHEPITADTASNEADEKLTIDPIIEVIKENCDNLQYEDGFGANEVKCLLSHNGFNNVSEQQIEALIRESAKFEEIEDGYFSIAQEQRRQEVLEKQNISIEIKPKSKTQKK